MKILKISENKKVAVEEAIKVLKEGGIVVYPTETCYGVGVDATNQEAVNKLMKYKSRREGKPMSVAVTDREMAAKYVEINDLAQNLYTNHLPGPITVVSKDLGQLADGVASEYGTLGIRIPDYQLVLDIVEGFGKPITSTSANVSYKPRPYSVDNLLKNATKKQLELIDLILDAGELPHNDPSTVVDTTMNNLNIMRQGAIGFEKEMENRDTIFAAKTDKTEDTWSFGGMVMQKFIDEVLTRPVVFMLKGELGAGKTQFVKGVATKLKIAETISSPTYTIIDQYDYQVGEHRQGQLMHMDTWRVDGPEELLRSGYQEYFKKGNVLAIEWADKFFDQIVELARGSDALILLVDFQYIDMEKRDIKVTQL